MVVAVAVVVATSAVAAVETVGSIRIQPNLKENQLVLFFYDLLKLFNFNQLIFSYE
jgi:hypothetical protein